MSSSSPKDTSSSASSVDKPKTIPSLAEKAVEEEPVIENDDDEFEEFPVQDFDPKEDASAGEEKGTKVWEDNWDDETVESEFSKQLNEELQKHHTRR